jgi:hypothetical protein
MRTAALALILLLPGSLAMADCKDDVIAVMDRSTLAGPYRTVAAMIAGERRITITSDVVPPGDLRVSTTVDGNTRDMMKIADRVWLNEGQGWRDAPPAVAAQVQKMASQAKSVEPSVVNDVDCLGTQAVDGRDVLVYSYKIDTPGGKGSSSNMLYVDPASRLPKRVVVEGRVGPVKSRTDMTYVFDTAIKLQAPTVSK